MCTLGQYLSKPVVLFVFSESEDRTQVYQSEIWALVRCIGTSYVTIAIQFLGYHIEEVEELEQAHRGQIDRVKFKILNGWLQQHPERNARYVSKTSKLHNVTVNMVNPCIL